MIMQKGIKTMEWKISNETLLQFEVGDNKRICLYKHTHPDKRIEYNIVSEELYKNNNFDEMIIHTYYTSTNFDENIKRTFEELTYSLIQNTYIRENDL